MLKSRSLNSMKFATETASTPVIELPEALSMKLEGLCIVAQYLRKHDVSEVNIAALRDFCATIPKLQDNPVLLPSVVSTATAAGLLRSERILREGTSTRLQYSPTVQGVKALQELEQHLKAEEPATARILRQDIAASKLIAKAKRALPLRAQETVVKEPTPPLAVALLISIGNLCARTSKLFFDYRDLRQEIQVYNACKLPDEEKALLLKLLDSFLEETTLIVPSASKYFLTPEVSDAVAACFANLRSFHIKAAEPILEAFEDLIESHPQQLIPAPKALHAVELLTRSICRVASSSQEIADGDVPWTKDLVERYGDLSMLLRAYQDEQTQERWFNNTLYQIQRKLRQDVSAPGLTKDEDAAAIYGQHFLNLAFYEMIFKTPKYRQSTQRLAYTTLAESHLLPEEIRQKLLTKFEPLANSELISSVRGIVLPEPSLRLSNTEADEAVATSKGTKKLRIPRGSLPATTIPQSVETASLLPDSGMALLYVDVLKHCSTTLSADLIAQCQSADPSVRQAALQQSLKQLSAASGKRPLNQKTV